MQSYHHFKPTIRNIKQYSFFIINFIAIYSLKWTQASMQQQTPVNYCQHFQHFKSLKKLVLQQQAFCKFCFSTNCSLWLCLHKNCGVVVCGKSNYLHLSSHMEQSKKKKPFNSIFINIDTAEIRCQYCNVEILDFEQLNQQQRKKILLNGEANNPLRFRFSILPYLHHLSQPKIIGQLEFPQGHRKINKGLVGIFSDRQNYSVIPAVQFLAHCDFFKQIVLSMRLEQGTEKATPILRELKSLFSKIQTADQRAIRIQVKIKVTKEFMQMMIRVQPKLAGYKRKDPFQTVLQLLNIMHEHLNFYRVSNAESNQDQWDMYYKSKEMQSHCPIYDSLASTLTLSYKCMSCGGQETFNSQINFIKLQFPRKKRKNKLVEKELSDKGYQSPRKRGKSLISYILPDQQLPITIPELFIQFLRQPFHHEKFCSKCGIPQKPMKPGKIQFSKLADILIFQINRLPKNTDQLIETNVLLNFQQINLSPFLQGQTTPQHQVGNKGNNQQKQINYEFLTCIGVQKGIFSLICKSRYNKKLYVIRNETVEMLSKDTNVNPYVICLKRVISAKAEQFYEQIIKQNQVILKAVGNESTANVSTSMRYAGDVISLPDFYHLQLKYGIELPVHQPLSCKHSKLKPNIMRKCLQEINITQKMYQHLVQTFGGTLFKNQTCSQCQQQLQLINKRKMRQKRLIKQFDSLKTNANVMISMGWLKKWSNYLYSHQTPSYFHKGYPFPPPIDNINLLQNNKCKPSLIKNKDFKIVNIFVFRLLKQLYVGGPQIRYKWKSNQLTILDQSKLKQIKVQAAQIKEIYAIQNLDSPKNTASLRKSVSYMETVNEEEIEQFQLQESK